MYFLPTDDQRELSRGVADLLAARFPLDRLPEGFDPALWQELTDTGVFALRTELGLGLAEAALVFEELGRACVPGPLVATFLAAGMAEGMVTGVDAQSRPLLVPHLERSAALLVLDTDVRLTSSLPTGHPVTDLVDPLSPLHELAEVPDAMPIGDAAAATRMRLEGAMLTAALQVGLAARVTELAVGYAKTREQFGHLIGSFQAVKHLCADMFVRAELARVAVHAAAVTLDDDGGGIDAARTVAGAKILADEAAVTNGRGAVQVHGGMGFTWEVPVHFFLKRAWLHATEFGTADDHAEALADVL